MTKIEFKIMYTEKELQEWREWHDKLMAKADQAIPGSHCDNRFLVDESRCVVIVVGTNFGVTGTGCRMTLAHEICPIDLDQEEEAEKALQRYQQYIETGR